MTPRYARLGGWLLLAAVVAGVVACTTPTVDGTDIATASEGAASTKRGKRTTSTSDTADSASPDTTTRSKNDTPMTQTTAVPTTSASTSASASATTTTTATTPPTASTAPVTPPPACGSADPLACLDCCLRANPGAVAFEDDYDACIQTCAPGDNACYDLCQSQHVTACAGNATCTKNHACMEANNCLSQNFCNPI